MSVPDVKLTTPIFLKTSESASPPEDEPVCYVLAGNGLYLVRKHLFFTSCVRARDWPGELAPQTQYLKLHCPKVPRTAIERIVGFFWKIARLHGSEAAAILFWNRRNGRICFEIPDQTATVTEGWNGSRYATDVRYETPHVDPDLSLFGSVHSHVDGSAYASSIDREDESYRPGLHIVVGRIRDEPPEVSCEYVVDGVRFAVDTRTVIEGYKRRDADVPREWIERVRVDVKRYKSRDYYYDGSYDRGPARERSTH